MVGIDLVKVSRFKDKENLAKKILSLKEEIEFNLIDNKENYLARAFSIKEAFLKALSKGLFEISFKDITLCHHENGKPYIEYKGEIYENVSLSHDGEYIISIVII